MTSTSWSRAHARRLRLAVCIVLVAVAQTGCAAIGLTVLGAGIGVGAGTITSYTLNGYAYRTFAEPLPVVERASIEALQMMGMQLREREEIDEGKLLTAVGNERTIKIRLEQVTSRATRIRAHVRIGTILMDRATATEIVYQTEEVLQQRDVLAQNDSQVQMEDVQ